MMTSTDIVRIEIDTAVVASQQLQGVLRDYLDCQQRIAELDDHFLSSCNNLRGLIEPGSQAVVLFGHQPYMVSHTAEGYLEVDELVRRGDA